MSGRGRSGGSLPAAVAAAAGTSLLGATVVLLGDSKTALSVDGETGSFPSVSADGYFNVANALAGNRFRVVKYAGVGGNTIAQMIARYAVDVTPYPSRYLAIYAGTNDVIGNRTKAQMLADLDTLLDMAASEGRIVLLALIGAMGGLTSAQRAVFVGYRRGCLDRQRARRVYVWDALAATVDPTSATLAPRTGIYYDSGTLNLHENNAGGYWEGRALAPLLARLEPPISVTAGYDDYSNGAGANNYLDNPGFYGTGGSAGSGSLSGTTAGGITGSVPTGWYVDRFGGATAVVSVLDWVDDDTGLVRGKKLRIAATFAAAGERIAVYSANASARAPAGAGQLWQSEISAQIVTPGVLDNVRLMCTCGTTAGEQGQWGSPIDSPRTPVAYPEASAAMRLATYPVLTIGPTVGELRMKVYLRGVSAGTCTVDLWAPLQSKVG